MSTISTIYLDEPRGVHIFHDLKSNNVVIEIDGDNNLHIFFQVMSFDEWRRYIQTPAPTRGT